MSMTSAEGVRIHTANPKRIKRKLDITKELC
jgi:hypothetical protein